MTNCCSAKDPGGPDTGSVMTLLLGKMIFRCVLLTTGCCLEIQSFLDLHAKETLAIRVEMFITLGIYFDLDKGSINMFTTLEIFFDAGDGNVVLVKCNTHVEAVPRFPDHKSVPLKPQDKSVDSIM